jgi:N-acyl-D-aspartate/D-glutamate deacylase
LVPDPFGYVDTNTAGVTPFADGTDTGARPGALLRGAR